MNIKLIVLKHLLVAAPAFFAAYAVAETGENFNSRKDVPIHKLKSQLQNSCWTFQHFDINHNGWNPRIEGDGAIVANTEAGRVQPAQILTPVLSVGQNLAVSFDYTFSENFSSQERRWMKICLASADNQIIQVLEEVEFGGASAKFAKKYSTEFKNIVPGEYRLVLQYGASGEGAARVALDELHVSAPMKYATGCNSAPFALRDKITGSANRTASGSVLSNDRDLNRETMSAYLIKGSPHGEVQLSSDGNFIFTPHEGFDGNTTSFVYKVCDEGAVNLCSDNKTVYINFPLVHHAALTDFKGSYKFNGNVELVWKTRHDGNAEHFEIERSTDGRSWENAGQVSAAASVSKHAYAYTDNVTKATAHRKDLYYRLKQVAADGSVSVSKLLVVRVYNTKTLTMISVTPNPAKNDIAVNVQLQESSYVSLRVLNGSGNSIVHKSIEVDRGTHNVVLEGTSGLQPGVYMLEVIVNSKERMLVKLVKD